MPSSTVARSVSPSTSMTLKGATTASTDPPSSDPTSRMSPTRNAPRGYRREQYSIIEAATSIPSKRLATSMR